MKPTAEKRHETAFHCPGAWYGNPGQNVVVDGRELDAALRFLLRRYRVTEVCPHETGNMEPEAFRISLESRTEA